MVDVFMRIRKGLLVAQTMLQPSEFSIHQARHSDLIYRWWATSVASDLDMMLNLALSLSSKTVSDNLAIEEEFERRCAAAAIAFTTFCTIRKYMREGVFDNIDFQDASQVLAPRLRELVESVLYVLPNVKATKDVKEALFWTCFIGTLFEQTDCEYRREMHEKWFGRRLVLHAQRMNMLRWTQARALFERFVLSETLGLHPFTWYENLVMPERTGT